MVLVRDRNLVVLASAWSTSLHAVLDSNLALGSNASMYRLTTSHDLGTALQRNGWDVDVQKLHKSAAHIINHKGVLMIEVFSFSQRHGARGRG